MKILSPEETIKMLGTKEEFEKSKKIDEDGDDLLGEKLNQEYQENMRDDLFDDMAMSAMVEAGLTEDEAERELDDLI